MKNVILILFLVGVFYNIKAQDIIFKKNGDEIKSKVMEVSSDVIKYKRFDNISGPLYSIKTKEVFMVKYENGTKDVFKATTQEETPKEKSVERKTDFPINPELIKYKKLKRPNSVIFEYQFNINRVLDTNVIYYYGFDFSDFSLCSPPKEGTENRFINFDAGVRNEFSDVFNLEVIRKKLHKEEFILSEDKLYKTFKDLDNHWIYCKSKSFTIEHVIYNVQNYRIKEEKSGIGMVLIIDRFDKASDKAYVIVTFFDIATRDVLWATKLKYRANGAGFTRHWGKGVIKCVDQFFAVVYALSYSSRKKDLSIIKKAGF